MIRFYQIQTTIDTNKAMRNVEHIKEKDAVLVPIKDWERMQKELVRLRKKVNKSKVLNELKAAIISIETDIRNGVEPRGQDAREFIKELLNEK